MGEEKGEGQEGELKYEGYKYVIEDDEIEDDDAESVDSVDTLPEKKNKKIRMIEKVDTFYTLDWASAPG